MSFHILCHFSYFYFPELCSVLLSNACDLVLQHVKKGPSNNLDHLEDVILRSQESS